MLERSIDSVRIMDHLLEIYRNDRWFDQPHFHATSRYCRSTMKKLCKLDEVQTYRLKSNGKTRYGDYIIPKAWKANNATCTIQRSDGGCRTVADYQNIPNSLHRYSAPTPKKGIEAAIVLIDGGDAQAHYKGKEVQGKIVFSPTVPASKIWRMASHHGAIGIISQWKTSDGYHWENHIFVPDNPNNLFGFSINKRDAEWLEKLLRKTDTTITAQVKIETQLYDDHLDTITGVITGTSDEEILVFAHLYEIGALDNASGSAAILEIARSLNHLIHSGKLKPPKRTIRFMLGNECYSLMDYLLNRNPNWNRISAGITLDQFGLPLSKDAPLSIVGAHGANANFADLLFKNILHDQLGSGKRHYIYTDGNSGDDALVSDPCFGIPFPLLTQNVTKAGCWHQSIDTPDILDKETLKQATIASARYIYELACAGKNEVEHYLGDIKKDAQEHLRKAIPAQHPKSADELEELQQRLNYLQSRTEHQAYSVLRLTNEIQNEKIKNEHLKTTQIMRVMANKKLQKIINASCVDRQTRPRSPLEIQAMGMIPSRNILGLLTLDTLPEEIKINNPYGQPVYQSLDIPLLWADGKKNLLTLYRLLYQQNIDNNNLFIYRRYKQKSEIHNLKNIIAVFDFLQKYGYIKMEKRHIPTISKIKLVSALRKVGIKKGNTIMVHSRMSGLGHIQGGPETVIQALEEAVGPTGTVVMPVFSYGSMLPFDPKTSPSVTGILSEHFRTKKGVLRSTSPTHSVAAYGPMAKNITTHHWNLNPYDRKGPFGVLYDLDAKLVFLGVNLQCNSFLHAAEDWNNSPYLKTESLKLRIKDRLHTATYSKIPKDHRDFYNQDNRTTRIYQHLYAEQLIKTVPIGSGEIRTMSSRKLIKACSRIMEQTPDIFLCKDPNCNFCSFWRKQM